MTFAALKLRARNRAPHRQTVGTVIWTTAAGPGRVRLRDRVLRWHYNDACVPAPDKRHSRRRQADGAGGKPRRPTARPNHGLGSALLSLSLLKRGGGLRPA